MNNKPEQTSLYDFFNRFPDEKSAQKYFEEKRWKDKRSCPHCGSISTVSVKSQKPMPYRCKDCRKHFSVRTGTVLESSRIPLHKWLMAIYMMTTARKGIPSIQMAKELGITQKSAWFLAQRIREAWLENSNDKGNNIQADETYIGGKEKNKHSSKKLRGGRGSVGKEAVLGIRNENGKIIAKHVQNTKAETLQTFIQENVNNGATVITDEHRAYIGLNRKGYVHLSVNHSIGEYVKEQIHTNGIESFWALLKRGYYGIYHFMSKKHLNRYVNEFSFRHNMRSLGTISFIESTISQMNGKRLTYKDLVNV